MKTHDIWQLKFNYLGPLHGLTHLVVNDGQLGANWYPIGTQLAPIFNNPPWRSSRLQYLITEASPENTLIYDLMLHYKIYFIVVESFLWKNYVKEILPVEKPIFGHFREILSFSKGNNWVTKPCFQSNSITVVWRIYRGKGFVLKVIEDEPLLASYYHLKTHFFPLWRQNGEPMGCHWQPNWVPIGYQLAPNWPSFTTKWVNW